MAGRIIQKVAESPARAVDEVIGIVRQIPRQRPIRIAKKYWGALGPGLTTGASDDDPSGITTYSQAGATFGLSFLWLSLFTIPFMIVAQEMCGRIAHVTGRGIAGVIKHYYSQPLLYLTVFLLFVANTISIGADIGGMVAATGLIFPAIPFGWLAAGFVVLSLFLEIGVPYATYARYLKVLTLVLLSYVLTVFFIDLDWPKVIERTLIPSFNWTRGGLLMITAVLGTTISPYLFFWQASQEIEEEREEGRKTLAQRQKPRPGEIATMRRDVTSGMIFSNLVMFFIIATTGTVLFPQGSGIATAAEAAAALEPLAGNSASLLFAVGIIGTGLLAIPVLAGSVSYAFAEAFSLNQGLDKKLKRAYGFYGVIIIAMGVGLVINFLGIDPIKALIFAAMVNGLITPILLAIILMVSNSPKIMGPWRNGPWSNRLGWFLAAVMSLSGVATIIALAD